MNPRESLAFRRASGDTRLEGTTAERRRASSQNSVPLAFNPSAVYFSGMN
jgi:hypothetical protein